MSFLAGLALAALLAGCALRPGTVAYLVRNPAARSLTVMTTSGPVRGVVAPEGEAFLGIPFAAPPVGALRFKPPAAVRPWTTVRDATKAGPICIQAAIPGSGAQSENCLTLNVYAPRGAEAGRRLPVMVWLYGGGFDIGDNVEYDPSRLAEREGVIVVAPNYRLGAFGFLAHPALRGPGEGAFALLDQQAALRWVRDNIPAFGGDPGEVTLFGQSAGAWSACYQMASPGARGLFQRVIIESGACASPISTIDMPAAEAGGLTFAQSLGCGDPTTAAACLRTLPAAKLRKAKAARRGLLGVDSWSPAVGGDVLPITPRRAFETGAAMAVPMIDGSNHDEGRLFLYTNLLRGRLWTEASYEKIIGDFFGPEITPRVLAEYAAEARRSRDLAYADLLTDSTFACPALTLDALAARAAPVYAYEFDDPRAPFDPPRPFFIPPLKAYHGSELVYVFQTPWALADPDRFDAAQRRLSFAMQDAWGAFARSGDPSTPSQAWPVSMGVPLTLAPSGDAPAPDFATIHRCAFWNALGY
jgi:para-nitrobenzyl esterase